MLSIENITRAYDGKPVLRGVDLNVIRGEIVCLLGPSGCGKTTLLRIIAGLETADGGDVRLDDQSILGVPIHQRDFSLMFQDFALFPHLNVAENIIFGLKMRGVAPTERERRLGEMLELVGLNGFERRNVAALSGGERQRVALARALAPSPRLLMLDEPLGSLDAALRERLVLQLRDIIKRVGLTALYVTHDQREAFAIADRIALMNAGRFEQIDAPPTLYRQPKTVFAARFLGLTNIIPIEQRNDGEAFTPLGTFPLQGDAAALLLHPDGITPDPSGDISGVVQEVVFGGDSYRLQLAHQSGLTLGFRLPARDHVPPRVGDTFHLRIDPRCVLLLKA